MRRKFDLAMTLVGRPRIILLDEPTTGLKRRIPGGHILPQFADASELEAAAVALAGSWPEPLLCVP